jgi:hypothetical protein
MGPILSSVLLPACHLHSPALLITQPVVHAGAVPACPPTTEVAEEVLDLPCPFSPMKRKWQSERPDDVLVLTWCPCLKLPAGVKRC